MPLDRSRHVQVHIYGQVLSGADKVRFSIYTEPWFENSSIIIQTLDELLTMLAKAGKTDITLLFDNKSDQHAFAVLGYLYYVTVSKKLFGPNGRMTVIYLHHGHHFNLADRKFSEASSEIVQFWKANGKADYVHPAQIVEALNGKKNFEASLAYTFLEASEKFAAFSVVGPKGETLTPSFIGISTLTSILIKNESEKEPRASGIFTKSRATDINWGEHRGESKHLDGFHLRFAEDPFGSLFPPMPEPKLTNDKCEKLLQKIETYRTRPGIFNWDYIQHLANKKDLALLSPPRKTLHSSEFLNSAPHRPFALPLPEVQDHLIERELSASDSFDSDAIPEVLVEKITDNGWVLDDFGSPVFMLETHYADKSVSWQPWSSFVDDNVNAVLLSYMDSTRHKDHYSHLSGPVISQNELQKLHLELETSKSTTKTTSQEKPRTPHLPPSNPKKRKAEVMEPVNEKETEEKHKAHDKVAEANRKVFHDAEKRLKRPRGSDKGPPKANNGSH